jgi:hypothetical protein
VLGEIGGHARFIELANATHVVGQGDTLRGSTLVQAFVAHPQAIDSLDASCALTVPPIHAVGVYPADLAQEPPITPLPGSGTSSADLRLAAAALATAGDAVARGGAIEASSDHGLFGGTVSFEQGETQITLRGDRLLPGVAVSGIVKLTPAPNPLDGEMASATLTVAAAGMPRASFTAGWTTAGAGAEKVASPF